MREFNHSCFGTRSTLKILLLDDYPYPIEVARQVIHLAAGMLGRRFRSPVHRRT